MIRDDFAGPGGWDEALRLLDRDDVIGYENDQAACDTARAAGHQREQIDLREARRIQRYVGGLEGYIASPPCQTFSLAGKGNGRQAVGDLRLAASLVATGTLPEDAVSLVSTDGQLDERSVLVLEPMLVIAKYRPQWVALEQVPGVLPIWEAFAEELQMMGYNVATGFVHSEQYGVPQTRKRAVLMAHQDRQVALPVPTHSKYHQRTPKKLDDGVPRWVSMAEALQWGFTGHMVSNYGSGGDPAKRGHGDLDEPAPTVTSKIGRNVVHPTHMGDVVQANGTVREIDQPAPTITASMDNGNFQWVVGQRRNSGPGAEREPRSIDAPSYTIRAHGSGSHPSGVEWVAGRPFDAEDDEIVYVNGTGANAARRSADSPAPTIHFGARLNGVEWQVDREALIAEVGPRVNNQSGTEFDLAWPADRLAPVIAGRELVTMPGANANRFNGSTKSRNDGIRVTVQEAGILQSFSPVYPWQGNKTKQFEQVGNAVPPVMGAAVLAALGVQVARAAEREETA